MSNLLSIFIKLNTGNTLSIELDPNWNIGMLKEKIAPNLGLAPGDIKIIFAGKELMDSIIIEECDLGQKSILHAVRIRHVGEECPRDTESLRPMNETLVNWQLSVEELESSSVEYDAKHARAHFFVYCSSPCKTMQPGKLRVRCSLCRSGAFTVKRDPQCWDDVLKRGRIQGICENVASEHCRGDGPHFAEFFFKCSEHASLGDTDQAVPLDLVKWNIMNVPCLACTEIKDLVLVFPCSDGHVTCLDCFKLYCLSRLRDRQFWSHPKFGYTLPCPIGCTDSLIKEIHHFHLLSDEQYAMYHRFGAEEYVLQAGGVLCPKPGCGMGILAPPDCRRIQCSGGCEFVFCRRCRQDYHLEECRDVQIGVTGLAGSSKYVVDPVHAEQARWDEASKAVICVITKQCPKCRTPTERSGGCMHMMCTRPQCGFNWCWICQAEWTRECMGNHWFG